MALTVGAQGAGQFFAFAPDISQAILSTINVQRLMDHIPIIDNWSKKGKTVGSLLEGHIEFRDVHFRYPTRYLYYVEYF